MKRVQTLVCALVVVSMAACTYDGDPTHGIPPPDVTTEPLPDVLDSTDGVVPPDVVEEEVEVPDGWEGDCTTYIEEFVPEMKRGAVGANMLGSFWVVHGLLSGMSWNSNPHALIDIESWPGYGGPIEPTTWVIDEFEGISTCPLCVIISESCHSDVTGDCDKFYMAERAIVDLDSISMDVGDLWQGMLSDAYLVEVGGGLENPVEGGDGFCVGLWEFTVVSEDWDDW